MNARFVDVEGHLRSLILRLRICSHTFICEADFYEKLCFELNAQHANMLMFSSEVQCSAGIVHKPKYMTK